MTAPPRRRRFSWRTLVAVVLIGERRGVSTGPVGRWTYLHRKLLCVAAVALATLILVFWGQPTGLVVIVLVVILLVLLGLIELIDRPPAPAAPA